MTKRILIDVDGVLADFVSAALKIGNKLSGKNVQLDEVTQWDLIEQHFPDCEPEMYEAFMEPGFARNLDVYEWAQKGVEMMKTLGEVRIVTSPIIGPTFCYDRVKWLEEHFDLGYKDIIFAYDKSCIDGTILIDDKPSNISGWIEARERDSKHSFLGVLWFQPWNVDEQPVDPLERIPHRIHTNSWCWVKNHLDEM